MPLVSEFIFWQTAPKEHKLTYVSNVSDDVMPIRKFTIDTPGFNQAFIEFENGQIAFASEKTFAGMDIDELLKRGYIDQEWYDRALAQEEERLQKEQAVIELHKEEQEQKYYLEKRYQLERALQATINAARHDKDEQEELDEILKVIQNKTNAVQQAFDEKFGS